MRIIVLGAGHVGVTIVEALYAEHDITVVDLDPRRLLALANTYDVRTVEGNGASRRTLDDADVATADLVFASTARDEANLVAAMLVRRLSDAKTLVRTTDVEHLAAWRAGVIDVDFMVSSELEAAREVTSAIAVPGARATDIFAGGQVLIVEFDVPATAAGCDFVGRPIADSPLPADSRLALIVRGEELIVPTGADAVEPGDRVIVMASPSAAHEWSLRLAPDEPAVDDVLVFGAGRVGTAIARDLLARRLRVRIAEPDQERARRAAATLTRAQVFHATGLDRDFLQQERVGQSGAAIAATGDDSRSLYALMAARARGVPVTIGIVDDPTSARVFEQAGVDVTVNPRTATAEEMIRFAHDPRTRQIAMLDDERFDVIDVLVRPDSEFVGVRMADMPRTGSMIGAIVRDGVALFPRGGDVLRPGDRAIVLVDPARASRVERAL